LLARETIAQSLFAHPNRVVKEVLAKTRDEGVKLGRDEGVKLGRDEGVKLGRDEGALMMLITACETRLQRSLDADECAAVDAHRAADGAARVLAEIMTLELATLATWLRAPR
jgi:hypothetical protein